MINILALNKVFYFIFIINLNIFSINLLQDLQKIPVIDFDISMQFKSIKNAVKLDSNYYNKLNLYKRIYDQNNFSKIKFSQKSKIPEIIHQIWLGPHTLPKIYKPIADKWQDMHPEWQYKLWTDENIKDLFPLYNQKYFDESKNYGEKSDILRYEILNKFGGIYVDIDYECIRPFDVLMHCYNFFAGIEPLDASPLYIGNAIIASKPGHFIIKECIKSIKNYRQENTIPKRTGPGFLSSIIHNKKFDYSEIIFLPATYLYPLCYRSKFSKNKNLTIYKETFGVHYWSGSWVEYKKK